MSDFRAVVVGQLARDLVLVVDGMPPAGGAADVRTRREMLGGKGANQAVALTQLGIHATLVAVAGDDEVADNLLKQARRDGIDISHVVRRTDGTTALIVEALDAEGGWRYLQHLPEEMLLTIADIEAARDAFTTADAVLVQLQQPPAAARIAARCGREAGLLVVLDGAPSNDEHRKPLLASADVVRADDRETRLLTGTPTDDHDRVRDAAFELLSTGPRMLALGLAGAGNLFVWRDPQWGEGALILPLTSEKAVDTTGGGDSFVAGLTSALLRGEPPPVAARLAVAAAGVTVAHPGGRPQLTAAALGERLAELDRRSPLTGGPDS